MNALTSKLAGDAARSDHFVNLRGLRFHYVRWGRLDAPVLITLHGLRSYAETFEGLAEALAERYCIISLDQRGRGLSDWDPKENYDTLTYVADLEAFVDALSLKCFNLLGHSMGGANALVYTSRNPTRVERLIIEDMGPGASASSDGAARIRQELANTPESFTDWDTARNFWRSIRPKATEEAIDSRVRHSLKQLSDGQPNSPIVWRHHQSAIAAARARIPPLDLWPHVDKLKCPVLLVRGMDSDFLAESTANSMQARCATLTHIALAGAGHYVHDDAPQEFIAAVSRFLEGKA